MAESFLVRAKEACEFLGGISDRTLWQLGRDGVIPVIRIGERSVRYDRRDLEAYINAQRARAASTSTTNN